MRMQVNETHPDYHAAPVRPFGPRDARLLVVGLAPGLHGANATGRPFSGGGAGDLIYRTLYDFAFASVPLSKGPGDDLELFDCRITNTVKCLPPNNKPVAAELNACSRFLRYELETPTVLVALGAIAHKAVIRTLRLRQKDYGFAHAAQHALESGQTLIDSYHCSRYNLNTGRLSPRMFAQVFAAARDHLA
jgi:uracil-DNA glycosylase family 4